VVEPHADDRTPRVHGPGDHRAGIAEELIKLSIRYGFDSLPAEWRNGNRQINSGP